MIAEDILLLTPREVRELLAMDECIAAVEDAFRLYGEGNAVAPGVLSMHSAHGGFHIKAGLLDLGEIVAGKTIGRESDKEIIVFDSTGMALQDAAAAARVYEKAREQGLGMRVSFAA